MARNCRRAYRDAPSALAIALLSALAAGAQDQGAKPPKVGARLIIDSPRLTASLLERKPVVEAEVSKWLAAEAQRRFGFLTWVGEVGPGTLPNRWVVHLEDDWAPGRTMGTNYFFSFSKVAEAGLEVELTQLGTSPFDSDRNPLLPTDDAAAFTKAVQDRLRALLEDEDFRTRLSTSFLYTISLTSELEVNRDAHALLLPFSFRDLNAGTGSRIAVQFTAPLRETGGTQSGDLVLRAAACLSRPEIGSRIRGEIASFQFAPTRIDQASFWNDAVADILRTVSPGSQLVRMAEYHFDDGSGDPCVGTQPLVTGP